MKTKRFVFDTNSLVSAILITSSASQRALIKAEKEGQLIFSKETLKELSEVLIRSKFDRYISIADRLEFIDRLETIGELIFITSDLTDCRDDKDNKFLNLAVDSQASCIITGDNDLLILNPFRKILIMSSSDFLNYLNH
jgi:putative PIN family toxin of toxin-antitoxin system